MEDLTAQAKVQPANYAPGPGRPAGLVPQAAPHADMAARPSDDDMVKSPSIASAGGVDMSESDYGVTTTRGSQSSLHSLQDRQPSIRNARHVPAAAKAPSAKPAQGPGARRPAAEQVSSDDEPPAAAPPTSDSDNDSDYGGSTSPPTERTSSNGSEGSASRRGTSGSETRSSGDEDSDASGDQASDASGDQTPDASGNQDKAPSRAITTDVQPGHRKRENLSSYLTGHAAVQRVNRLIGDPDSLHSADQLDDAVVGGDFRTMADLAVSRDARTDTAWTRKEAQQHRGRR